MDENITRCGVAAIIGRPNSGKSTLLNSILDTKLSIVTPKPQTTRKKVLGIYTSENSQIIFLDTPGILKPKYKMHEAMMDFVYESIGDADVVCAMLDASKYANPESSFSAEFLDILRSTGKPAIVIINKIDLLQDVKGILPMISDFVKTGAFKEYIGISATKKTNVEQLLSIIAALLPESSFLYDEDYLSSLPERFFVSEIIRETIFFKLREEIPYSTEVLITEFRERGKGKWYISAEIVVEKDSQKRITIGAKGDMLRSIGESARKQIENYLEREVFLELFVKVRNNWRNNENMLRRFGY